MVLLLVIFNFRMVLKIPKWPIMSHGSFSCVVQEKCTNPSSTESCSLNHNGIWFARGCWRWSWPSPDRSLVFLGSCSIWVLKVSKDGRYAAIPGAYFAAMSLSGWIFLCFVWICLVSDCDLVFCPFPVHCWEGSDYLPSVKRRMQVGPPFLNLFYLCWTKSLVPFSLL